MNSEKNKVLKTFIYFLLLSMAVLFIFRYSNIEIRSTKEKLVKGNIDLTNSNLNENSYKLDGEWSFFYGVEYYSKDFKNESIEDLKPEYIKLEPWDKLGYKKTGVGTYRAVIKKEKDDRELGIKISQIFNSYRLYINGDLIDGIGNPKINKKSKVTSDYHFFNTTEEELEIIIHVENADFYLGGILTPPEIGTNRNISIKKDFELVLSIVVISMLIIVSIILIIFYLTRNKDDNIVFLAIADICYIMRILINTNGPAYFLYYTIDFNILIKLVFIFTHLTTFFIFSYYFKGFEDENKIFSISIKVLLLLFIPLIIFVKIKNFYYVNILSIIINSLVYLYIFIKASNDLFKYRKNAIFNFSGALILLISFTLDIDTMNDYKFRIIGLLVFCLFVILDTLKNYLSTYKNIEDLKNNLEIQIEDRTMELMIISENLQKEMEARNLAEENLQKVSTFDLETGIYKQDYAIGHLEDLISVYYRHNHIFSLILLEIDKQEDIENTFGINILNKVILETLETVKGLLRRTDIFAKWKDNTYIILMPNCLLGNAIIVAQKIKDFISENVMDEFGATTISIGIVSMKEEGNFNNIVEELESNLKTAQNLGGNSYYPKV